MATRVQVALGPRSYEVHIGSALLEQTGLYCSKLNGLGRRCAVITDSNVGPLYAERVESNLQSAGFEPTRLTVPAGESSKALSVAGFLCDQMIAAGLDRKSFVIALGGGVIGDLAGFVAAIYFRGIPYVQIPTTVVSQVDSSVGGKTGVNAPGGKNLIGAFHQPLLVLADVDTLQTLPKREFNEGFAEIVKHAIIRDADLFGTLAKEGAKIELAPLITRNVQIKAQIVGEDEFETKGLRALLNFGHTIGHAIENSAGYGRYLHGEAISLGLVAAARISASKAGLSGEEVSQIEALLRSLDLPTLLPNEIPTASLMAALGTDKKFVEGKVRFVVSPKIGSAYLSNEVTAEEIEAAIEDLRA